MAKSKLRSHNGDRSSARKRPQAATRTDHRNTSHMPEILTPRQQLVLLLRFAPDDGAATHEQVAEAMGVSREAVRRLERDALRRLRLDSVNPSVNWCGWDEV